MTPCAHLGLPKKTIEVLETAQQIAVVDDDILDLFSVDVIPVFANPPAGYQAVFVDDGDGGSSFKDEFGATLRKPKSSYYYDWREFPLSEPSLDALAKMPWPDPADPAAIAACASESATCGRAPTAPCSASRPAGTICSTSSSASAAWPRD